MERTKVARAIRILTVDDHPILRDGIAALLETQADMELVGEAQTGAEALDAVVRLRPDVTLMDLQMPGMGGLEAIVLIRQALPKARIVVLTTYAGDVQAVRALKAGACGYLLKSALRKELLDTIRAVHAGRKVIPPGLSAEIAEHVADEELTAREADVLRLAAQGEANKRIAWRLKLSEDTVKAHMKNIFSKLDASNRAHAVALAIRRGIIES